MPTNNRNDRLSAIVMFITAILIFVSAINIPESDLSTLQMGPGTGAFPTFLAVLLAICSVALFVTAGRRGKSLGKAPKEAEKVKLESSMIEEPFSIRVRRTTTFIIMLCAYILILPYAGFVIATTIVGTAFLITLFKEKIIISLFKAMAISAFCYLIFEIGLRIPLPAFLQAIKH